MAHSNGNVRYNPKGGNASRNIFPGSTNDKKRMIEKSNNKVIAKESRVSGKKMEKQLMEGLRRSPRLQIAEPVAKKTPKIHDKRRDDAMEIVAEALEDSEGGCVVVMNELHDSRDPVCEVSSSKASEPSEIVAEALKGTKHGGVVVVNELNEKRKNQGAAKYPY